MDTTPQPPEGPSTRKVGLIGGLIGAAGLAVSIFALTATAGAASPTLAAQDTEPAPEAIEEEIPEEWQAAEECWNGVAAKFGLDVEGDFDEDLEESIDWDAFDAEAEACEDLLPQEVKDQIAADEAEWEAYDTCVDAALEEAGIDVEDAGFGVIAGIEGDFDFGPAVSIETGDALSFAEFGDGDATITITKTGDDISVTSTGDVTIEDVDFDEMFEDVDFDDAEFLGEFPGGEELDNALSSCEEHLPEGIDFDDAIVVDEVVND